MTKELGETESKWREGSKIGVFLVIGLAIGLGFGAATDNLPVGVALGIGIGLILNAASSWKRKPKVGPDE